MQTQNQHPKEMIDLSAKIQGWGVDLDPSVRPGVPREKPSDINLHYAPIDQQVPRSKIFMSIERRELTPVFGTAQPPRGISGMMRQFAYTRSEAQLSRWMTLLLADRVDMVEGLVEDLLSGHIPNFAKEMGLKSELRDSRRLKKLGLFAGAGVLALVFASVVANNQRAAVRA